MYRRKNVTRLDHLARVVLSAALTAHTRPSDHVNEERGFQQPQIRRQESLDCMIEDLHLRQIAGGHEAALIVTAMTGTATMATAVMNCPS